jgi:hypothetical protein
MSHLSWIRVLNGRFATAVRFIGDQVVVVAVGGEQQVLKLADWKALPLAI